MKNKVVAVRNYPLKRIKTKILFFIASEFPFIKGEYRAFLFKMGGVKIKDPKSTFIGYNVYFDDLYPEDITIEPNTLITSGVKILSHFVDSTCIDFKRMHRGKVLINSFVFIGMNTVIVKPIEIGEGVIVGANSVVNIDLEPYNIYSGNPISKIKKRLIYE